MTYTLYVCIMLAVDTAKPLEPAADVLARAAEAGFRVAPARLARWHRVGLMPTPEVRSLGKSHGTQSVYPAGAGDQLVKLCELRKQHGKLDEIGWWLWWHGYPVAEHWGRGYLEAAAQRIDPIIQNLRRAYEEASVTDEAGDRLAEVLAAGQHQRLADPVMRRLRGGAGAGYFDTLMYFIVAFVAGDINTVLAPTGDTSDRGDALQIFERATGLSSARENHLAGIAPWLTGEIGTALKNASAAIAEASFSEILVRTSAADLLTARDELRDIALGLIAASRGLQRLFGVNQKGLEGIADIFEHGKARNVACVLIAWCYMRGKEWAQGYMAVLAACRQLTALAGAINR